MNEVWKDIEGYYGLYKVSNLGNVFSCNVNRNLKQETVRCGYKAVVLRKDGKQKAYFVHRLVANAFIPNQDNLPIINHKDENPKNNCVDNLEWCTYSYNNTYNDVHIKRNLKMSKEVFAYNDKCELVHHYEGVNIAAKDLGFSSGLISECCNGTKYTHKNLVWSYCELTREEIFDRFSKSAIMNKKNNKLSKNVAQFDLNKNFIKEYPSTQEAHRQLGISQSLIASVCRGEHKSTHGYVFKYT